MAGNAHLSVKKKLADAMNALGADGFLQEVGNAYNLLEDEHAASQPRKAIKAFHHVPEHERAGLRAVAPRDPQKR